MDYIICREPGSFELRQKEPPGIEKGKALLRIKKVGICGTDLHAYRGQQAFFTYPRILGHELAAEIISIENGVTGLAAGDKVGVMPYIGCGRCYACKQGKPNCCSTLQVLGVHADGGMQQLISIPVALLVPAANLGLKEIALIEPLAIGAHAIRRAGLKQGEVVLVMGCGPIGLGIAVQARSAGATVVVTDTSETRLDAARTKFGLDQAVPAGKDALAHLNRLTSGDMAAVVFDATGNRQALESGPDYLSHGGRFVLVGLYRGILTFDHPKIHSKEASLLCSRNATRDDFLTVMDQLKEGHFPINDYVTHEVPYQEMISHFDDWLRPELGVIKAMVDF